MSDEIVWAVDELAELDELRSAAVTGAVMAPGFVAALLHPVTAAITAPNPLSELYSRLVAAGTGKAPLAGIQPETPRFGKAADLPLQHDPDRFQP